MINNFNNIITNYNIQHRRYILGITSTWLLLPVSICYYYYTCYNYIEKFIINWSFISCIVSTCCYPILDYNFKVIYIDRLCAGILFFLLNYITFIYNSSIQHNLLLFPINIIFFYTMSRYLTIYTNYYIFATISHLCFRYVGYIWLYYTLLDLNYFNFLLQSFIYWFHIIISVIIISSYKDFYITQRYLFGCFELLIIYYPIFFINL
jgi:hypothetical protein